MSADNSAAMKCPHCGIVLTKNTMFCTQCGAAVDNESESGPSDKKKKNKSDSGFRPIPKPQERPQEDSGKDIRAAKPAVKKTAFAAAAAPAQASDDDIADIFATGMPAWSIEPP